MTRKLAILALMILVAVPASAATFMSFSQVLTQNTLFDLLNGNPTLVGSAMEPGDVGAAIRFSFSVATDLGPANVNRDGELIFNGQSSVKPQSLFGVAFVQTGFAGSGEIVDALTGTVVLSFTYSGEDLLAAGTGGSFLDLAGGATVTYASRYLNFAPNATNTLSFNLGGGSAWSLAANGFLNNNSLSVGGSFATDPLVTGAPEPTTMALFGSALIGLGLLGRKRFQR